MRGIAAAALVVLGLASPADAQPRREIALPDTRTKLSLSDAWVQHDAPGVVAGFRTDSGLALAVTRAQVSNPDAWRSVKARETLVDHIERGITLATPKYKRISRKITEINTYPVLDLEVRRAGNATMLVRVILYRTFSLGLAIEVPKGVSLDEPRTVIAAFVPPPPPPPPPASPAPPTTSP